MTIQQGFQLAVQHHQAGRLKEAEAIYRQILAVEPRHVEALHLLGCIAQQMGRSDVAVDLILRAVALAPNVSAFHSNLGEAHRKLGQLGEAIAAFRRAIELQPNYAEAYSNLGNALRDQGHLDEAIAACRRAIHLQPDTAVAHRNLGNALSDQGRLDEALTAYRRAIQLHPGYAEAHNNLGVALCEQGHLDEAVAAFRTAIRLDASSAAAHTNLGSGLWELGRLEEAIAAHRRAIQLQPDCAEAHSNLGVVLRDHGHLDEAIAACRRAIQLDPHSAKAHSNLGVVLRDHGHLDEAIAACRRAIQLDPHSAKAHSKLGIALATQGGLDEAIAACRQAIQIKPDSAVARWNTGALLLLQGDFEGGWPLFEARWEGSDLKGAKREFPQPVWKGEALHGRRVFIHAEAGFGDTLQFVRYAPLVAQRGGHVIVECQPGLKTLLASLDGVAQIIERGEPWPAFDLHIPMISLPLAFGTRLETIPAAIPYLRADTHRMIRWRERLERLDPASEVVGGTDSSPRCPLKIGLIWAGGGESVKKRSMDRRRSLRLSQFAPLAAVPGVVFVSLQKGEPAAQAKTAPKGMRLIDWTDKLEDFADTAALIECLDLVISVDTAVAHLAGALGKPVWVLNRFDTCWRWLVGREDSPWYPTMRLFRQPRFLDWEPAIQSVAVELTRAVEERALASAPNALTP